MNKKNTTHACKLAQYALIEKYSELFHHCFLTESKFALWPVISSSLEV